MFTNNLKKIVTKRKKRVGRGGGSGKGFHTSGRGQKGQTSRAGYSRPKGFDGGQGRLNKNLPVKRGFKALKKSNIVSLNIARILEKGIFEISNAVLHTFTKSESVKLVGLADYTAYDLKKVVVKSDVVLTKSLKASIVDNGGKVEEA